MWKKRKVLRALLVAFWLEVGPRLPLARPTPPLLLLAVTGVAAGCCWAPILALRGVAGITTPPAQLAAASCHGLGRAAAAAALLLAVACPAAGLSFRLPAADAELRVGALNRAGASLDAAAAAARAAVLPEADRAAAVAVGCLTALCAGAAAAGGGPGACLGAALLLLLVAASFLAAASTPRCPAGLVDWSVWRVLGWLYCTTALPSSLTCSRCLSSSLNTIRRETAPAAVGRQVIGSSTLLCGATALLQLRLAAAGRLGSAAKLKPSCTGTLSTPRCWRPSQEQHQQRGKGEQ